MDGAMMDNLSNNGSKMEGVCAEHNVEGAKELAWIKADEAAHITWRRMLFYFINFCFLFVA